MFKKLFVNINLQHLLFDPNLMFVNLKILVCFYFCPFLVFENESTLQKVFFFHLLLISNQAICVALCNHYNKMRMDII